MAQAKYASTRSSGGSYSTGSRKKSNDERRFDDNANTSQRVANKRAAARQRRDDAANPVGSSSHYAKLSAQRAAEKAGRAFSDAIRPVANAVSKDTSKYHNPTASGSGGSGRGGKMDREWKNHKWVSRERNEDGKWVYDYGTVSGGNNQKRTKEGQARANLNISAKKAGERNTGSSSMLRGSIQAASISKKAQNLVSGITSSAQSVGDIVGKSVSDVYNQGSQALSEGMDFLSGLAGELVSNITKK